MTPRDRLLADLARYHARHPGCSIAARFRAFVGAHPGALDRQTEEGHVTASAWIVDRSAGAALLVHHPKLGRWLQPGGHLEAKETTARGSEREAREETGLTGLRLRTAEIFDLDIHSIPARGAEPEHLHYDVRHVFEASAAESPAPREEVKVAEWVRFHDIGARTEAPSVLRLLERTLALD